MYKVFINDKEVRFINETDHVPASGHEFPEKIPPAELAGSVQAFRESSGLFYVRVPDTTQYFARFLKYFPEIKAAGGAVSDSSGKNLLMIHRQGKWDLPKGKIDAGESPETAAIREVKEECGVNELKINSSLANTYHMYEYRGMMTIKKTFWYAMVSTDKGPFQPQLEEGITEARWINKKDIFHLLPSTYASIADLVLKNILNS